MQDLLRESPLIQEFLEEGKLEEAREILLTFVQARFPELVSLAKEVASGTQDRNVLQDLILKIGMAHTFEEAQKSLLKVKEQAQSSN